ncbi:PhzF family phenazine biosynthesis protein [Salsuginibacillus kocurii]|uniref:PhzF family phenazine biosynthesis protein n=1 Tax=Salsuginibacillus kocurii TaxID=427078 RepID=UPI00035DC7E8|nr:PhzF family phenazine biosynthesis protein [Salsuginibacillus kocurii]
MKTVKVYHYDAFCNEPNKGNPAGLVLNGDDFSEQEMQEIAYAVGFNETSFLVTAARDDVGLKFFTPGKEMNLWGHATVATVYALKSRGWLPDKNHLTIETKAGSLPVHVSSSSAGAIQITMQQAQPQFQAFNGSKEGLAQALGVGEEAIDETLPLVYGSTGNWTLLVPIKKLATFQQMTPQPSSFPKVLTERPEASIHPFCLETYGADAHMHGRHFSSPHAGTIEDPVTGTASAVMGAYYANYMAGPLVEDLHLLIEQGQEMGKDGRVLVSVADGEEGYEITITGEALFVKEFEVALEE